MRIINARVKSYADLVDITIEGEKITSITPSIRRAEEDVRADDYDADSRLVTPQFAEAHIHLDYANTAGVPRENNSGTLFEAIEIWADRKAEGFHVKDDIKAKALQAAKRAAEHGVGFIRTHVDVTDPTFAGFEALAELRDEVRDWCDIQIVAFPQNGIFAYEGGQKLISDAMVAGADVVGGIPHLEPTRDDGVASVKWLFDLAEKHSAPIDIHTDEIDDPHSRFVEVLAAEASKRDMGPQTVVSHSVAMAYYTPGYMARLLPKLANSKVRFAVCPNENLHLQGLGFQGPVPRGVAPVKELTEFGIPVSFCQDSLNDPFYPMGNGDLLRILDSGLHVSHMLTAPHMENALSFITTNPAGNLGLPDYEIAENTPANLLVLDAFSDKGAVQTKAAVLLSIHNGKKVLSREPEKVDWNV
ncbi:Cytosine deaminase [Corynebacterium deserti GIMN1.010]|uniref:Cytosine deaminase n=1 Tax=Corynebacterium deserti GIMN1.010 TaxID=931089 RepID=A0A0M5IPR9_9CORY|nr:amidohydrolase family protein [Corynebacterium deserti]ALC07006.1 Cytosine deaminase [Corynebacterium deserti GIMN1.010]